MGQVRHKNKESKIFARIQKSDIPVCKKLNYFVNLFHSGCPCTNTDQRVLYCKIKICQNVSSGRKKIWRFCLKSFFPCRTSKYKWANFTISCDFCNITKKWSGKWYTKSIRGFSSYDIFLFFCIYFKVNEYFIPHSASGIQSEDYNLHLWGLIFSWLT